MEVGATYCAPAASRRRRRPAPPLLPSTSSGARRSRRTDGRSHVLLDGATGVRGAGSPSSKGANAFLDGLRAAGRARRRRRRRRRWCTSCCRCRWRRRPARGAIRGGRSFRRGRGSARGAGCWRSGRRRGLAEQWVVPARGRCVAAVSRTTPALRSARVRSTQCCGRGGGGSARRRRLSIRHRFTTRLFTAKRWRAARAHLLARSSHDADGVRRRPEPSRARRSSSRRKQVQGHGQGRSVVGAARRLPTLAMAEDQMKEVGVTAGVSR